MNTSKVDAYKARVDAISARIQAGYADLEENSLAEKRFQEWKDTAQRESTSILEVSGLKERLAIAFRKVEEAIEAIKGRDETIRQHEHTIRGNEQTIRQNEQTIRQNERTMRQNEVTIQANEQTIRGNEQTIRQNEETMRQSEQTIRDNDETIRVQQTDIDQQQDGIRDLNATIGAQAGTIETQQQTIDKYQDEYTRKRRRTGGLAPGLSMHRSASENDLQDMIREEDVPQDQTLIGTQDGPGIEISTKLKTFQFQLVLGPSLSQPGDFVRWQISELPVSLSSLKKQIGATYEGLGALEKGRFNDAPKSLTRHCLVLYAKRSSNGVWTVDNPGMYACRACANKQRPCIVTRDGVMYILPLAPSLRFSGTPPELDAAVSKRNIAFWIAPVPKVTTNSHTEDCAKEYSQEETPDQ